MDKKAVPEVEWKLFDNSSAKFTKLENFYFVESCACNEKYDIKRNDGKNNVYLAVQSKDMKLSVRSIDVTDSTQSIDTFIMPVRLRDGTEELTSFGSKLSDTGILWLCIFNRNTILGLDLNTKQIAHEFRNVPCPNDICVSPTDPNTLFVAGGAGVRSPSDLTKSSDEIAVVRPPIGHVYKIDTVSKRVTDFFSKDLHSLAGIECLNGKIFISQLYEIKVISSTVPTRNKGETVWEGADAGDGSDTYFSDNLSIWDSRIVASSIYRKMDTTSVASMKSYFTSTAGWTIGKLITSCVNCFTGAPNATSNGELLMSFSTKDVFEDVHFVLFDAVDGRKWHLKMDNKKLNMPTGCTFDGHVTHVQRHGGKVVFVNFKSSHVMLLDETAVLKAIGQRP